MRNNETVPCTICGEQTEFTISCTCHPCHLAKMQLLKNTNSILRVVHAHYRQQGTLLMGLVNRALERAKTGREKISGAINWSDLRCTEASYVVEVHGENYYQVTIEECAPGTNELIFFVQQFLKDNGWEHTEQTNIQTEW